MSIRDREEELREIRVLGDEPEVKSIYHNNALRLSKYTWISILPKNLFEQFQRTSNIWFLIVSIFQLVPYQLNPTDAWTTILPLSILLLLTLLKDAYQDWKLKKQDSLINSMDYYCWDGCKFSLKKSKDILVGDIVKVEESQTVPADAILLDCDNMSKIVFCDMAQLTGTAVLKQVKAVEKHQKIILHTEDGMIVNSNLNCIIKVPEPNLDYSKFHGRLKLVGEPSSMELKTNNLLFKGSTLLGTNTAICLAIYCGCESKMQLNSQTVFQKTSRLEDKVNKWIIYILVVLALLVLLSVLEFYFSNSSENSSSALEMIITFTLLYNNIIPISLFMVIDIIRFSQSYFLAKNIIGLKFNTEKLNENLGQVEYLLTDKTGTLTENNLKVKIVMVNERIYYEQFDDILVTDEGRYESEMQSHKIKEGHDTDFLSHLKNLLQYENESAAGEFVRCMALCNTLVKFKSGFLGSQDEIALVKLAGDLGFSLREISSSQKVLDVFGRLSLFEVVATRPFTTEIKKSRVLVYEQGSGHGLLYIKGDPLVLMPIINKQREEKQEILKKTTEMNEKGYRVMIMAYKEISIEEVFDFKSRVKKAEHSLLNFDGKIETMFKELEKKSEYLGFTCIEDEILPETISAVTSLKRAGIKIWVLSGDSFGNAVMTSRKSHIIDSDSAVVQLKENSDDFYCLKNLKILITQYIIQGIHMNRTSGTSQYCIYEPTEAENEESQALNTSVNYNPALRTNKVFRRLSNVDMVESEFDKAYEPTKLNYTVHIDRISFLTATNNENSRKLFVLLLVNARSVVFSMMMPEDKGKIVRMLKENVKFKPIVVAIGDGEADIPMIKMADVGISVNIHPTSVVKNFSDFSINKFSDLEDLILKYGHWNYSRLARFLYLFLYKNFFLTVMILSYTFYCSYSGTSLFDASLLVGYNIFFTTLPVMIMGIFDQDFTGYQIEEHREIYMLGIKGSLLNWKKMLVYSFIGIIQGVILSAFIYFCVPDIVDINGGTLTLEHLGTMVYITLIMTVLIQIYLETYCYNALYYISHGLSIFFLLIFLIVQNEVGFTNTDLLGIGLELKSSPFALFTIFCTSVVCVIPYFALRFYYELFFPNSMHLLSENTSNLIGYNRLEEYKNSLLSVYTHSSIWKSTSKDEKFSLNIKTLRYNLLHIEKEYKEMFLYENFFTVKWTAFAVWVLLIAWTIFSALLMNAQFLYTLSRIIICAGFGVLVFIIFTKHFRVYFKYYILGSIFVGLLTKFALEVGFRSTSILATSLIPSVSYVLLCVDWLNLTMLIFLNVVLVVISLNIEFNDGTREYTILIIGYIILTIAISATSAIVGYYLEIYKRTEYRLMNISNAGVERNQNILSLLLPPFVKNRVREGVRYIAEAQDEVTVLFCDICDFESICTDYKPRELRVFLDSLFKIFDRLCESTGVTKIETVGKTYMACAGLNDSDQELPLVIQQIHHTRRVTELAFSMLQEVKTIRLTNGNWLNVKIGINTGPVIAGVVGYHKPQFSLVGDTINTASRMCSTLEEHNAIQITLSTYDYIKDNPEIFFTPNTVEAKGKGTLDTYIIKEVLLENSSDIAGGPGSSHTSKMLSLYSHNSSIRIAKRSSLYESYHNVFHDRLERADTALISTSSWCMIKFNESEREKDFRYNRLGTNSRMVLLSLLIALVAYCINLLLSLVAYFYLSNYSNLPIILGRGAVVISIAIILLLHHIIYMHMLYPVAILFVLLCMLIIALFGLIYSTNTPPDMTALEIMYIILILTHSSGASLFLIVCANLCVFIPWAVLALYTPDNYLNITNLLLVACFSGINFLAVYIQGKKHRVNYNLNLLANKEIKETEKLLAQMMPPHVLEALQNDIAETDRLIEVTILYADIVGFTNWSSNKSPEEVVLMLSQFFTRFDKMCIEYDVYKVHTIGDCYVVLGYSGNKSRDPVAECYNVVKMAQSMVDIIYEENEIQGFDLNMRIGIHTGEVIAGVIGTNTVRYDIWGRDVLIANKMESNGQPGFVNVSENTKNVLEKDPNYSFEFIFNKDVKIQTLDKFIPCYFIRNA